MNVYSDKPIVKTSDDSLNRRDYAMRIADFLITNPSSDCLTVSINGQWGSGKTSFINLIKESIDILCSKGKIVHPMIVDFSPWNAASPDKMIKQFLESLKNNFSIRRYKKLLKAVDAGFAVANVVCELAPIPPIAGKIISAIRKQFKRYVEAYNKDDELEAVKHEVENCLKNAPFRYIVFIDDIDRLNNEEIVMLIQLIKSVCCFSNITYVLSFDKSIVSGALKAQQSFVDGDKYLEKIVQVEFSMPSTMHSKVVEFLSKDLDSLLEKYYSEDVSREIEKYYSYGLFSQIRTIREERRFINRLQFEIASFANEINIADLVAITYLRCIDERIVGVLVDYQEYLFGETSLYGEKIDLGVVKKDFFAGLEKTRLDLTDNRCPLLEHMFPHMFSKSRYSEEQHLNGKISYPSIFHKYLQMDYDFDDFSLDSTKRMLEFSSADDFDDFYRSITNGGQGRRLLQIIKDYSETCHDKERFKIIFRFLFNKLGSMPYSRPFFFVDKNFYIETIVKAAIKNLGQIEVEGILKSSINTYYDLYSLFVVLYLALEGDKEKIVLNDACIGLLKDRLKKLLVDYLTKNIRAKQYRSEFVIHMAIDYFGDTVRETLKEKTNEWLSHFITASMNISWAYSDYKHLLYRYDEKRIFSVIDKKAIQIDEMINNSTNVREKQRLIVFKMQINGVKPKEDNMFRIEEVQSFCKSNSIDFIASDQYENE